MASITNQLVTVLRLQGQLEYAQGLQRIAGAAQQVAETEQQAARAAKQLADAQKALSIAEFAAGLYLFQQVTAVLNAAVQAGSEFERAMIRAGVAFRNAGINMTGPQAADIANRLSLQTGTNATDILNTEAYLARFHVGAGQIPRDMRIIIDAAKYTNHSVQEMAHAIEMAHMGSSRALRDMGIPVHQLNGYLVDMQSLFDAVNEKVQGMARALQNTVPGQLDRLVNNWNQLLQAMERLNAGPLLVIFRGIADALELAVKHADALVTLLETAAVLALTIRYGWAGLAAGAALVAFLEISRRRFNSAAAQAALGGPGSKMEEYARQTAFNTGPQGPLGQALRPGGSFGEPGGGLRIRDYNQQVRHLA
jgi:hypothetical protein